MNDLYNVEGRGCLIVRPGCNIVVRNWTKTLLLGYKDIEVQYTMTLSDRGSFLSSGTKTLSDRAARERSSPL